MNKNVILCYGDSNTWGRDPETVSRFAFSDRWPGIVQETLGETFLIAEEGLPGRTTIHDDPDWKDRNGKTFLPVAMETHYPIDMLIISLGVNDLKIKFHLSPEEITDGVKTLIEIARDWIEVPKHISIICPSPCTDVVFSVFENKFEGGIEKSQQLAQHYEAVAKEYDCGFIDAGKIAPVSNQDGLHYDAKAHKLLAEEISKHILSRF